MPEQTAENVFYDARKIGIKEYKRKISNGESGFLPSLEGLLNNTEIVSEVDIGISEIPLKKIIGTYYHSRSLAFSNNFMPILSDKTEFYTKWVALCEAHLKEGIKHSIKVYEYLNWFYVVEGNKRVSVLKYFDAYGIFANVTRLIPRWDSNEKDIKIYYEFLKFNKKTKISSIWFSKEGSFGELSALLKDYSPSWEKFDSKYIYFERMVYDSFRSVYHTLGGEKLNITTGDAFLEYAKIYGIPLEFNEAELKPSINEFINELELMVNKESVHIQTIPFEETSSSMLSTLTSFVIPPKKLKIAFAYARTINSSGWTNSHEMGRQYVTKILKDQITTSYMENIPEGEDSYEHIKILAENGNDVIFTTSPIFLNATLKCSLEYPHIKFFNCSESQPFLHVINYYGRSYEPKFLMGIVGGSLTKTNILGYIATKPTPEVISSINAFSLGAKLVNPYVKVLVYFTQEWNSRIKIKGGSEILSGMDADIIANKNLKQPNPISKEYGVFSMLSKIDNNLNKNESCIAAPIWNWGLFYEKILKNILNGTFKDISEIFSSDSKLLNFWWGMASGVLDIFYLKDNIPTETEKLLNLMKKMIIDDTYNPFTGPIYDSLGNLRIENDEVASHHEILSMDYYVDNVEIIE
ncbi:MAG: BMP family ABC transporter substrate-binding protein [Clostridiaceae bacterium]